MNLRTVSIILKTIASTVNLVVGYSLVKGNTLNKNAGAFKAYMVFMALNLVGIWV